MSDSKLPSACSRPLPPHAAEGIQLFNRCEFFEAHEALENAWRAETGEIRDLYRGILQIAVSFLHITRGNYKGALKVYERSQKWISKWPDTCQGVNVKKLREDAKYAIDTLKQLGEENIALFDPALFKPIQLVREKTYICDRCGHKMYEKNCKITCPNCGYRFDCSDLNIYFD